MSLSFEWFGLAEGAAEDSRGTTVLIGVNQNVAIGDQFPLRRRYSFVAIVQDDEKPEPILVAGKRVQVHLSIEDPEGVTLVSTRASSESEAKRFENVPAGLMIVADARVAFEKPGEHTAKCEISVEDERIVAEKHIYVVASDSQ